MHEVVAKKNCEGKRRDGLFKCRIEVFSLFALDPVRPCLWFLLFLVNERVVVVEESRGTEYGVLDLLEDLIRPTQVVLPVVGVELKCRLTRGRLVTGV